MLFKKADQVLKGKEARRKLSNNNNVIPIKCDVYTMPQFKAKKKTQITYIYTHYLKNSEFKEKYKW